MKCDELKPECKKCSSTGRKCDGYSDDTVGNKLLISKKDAMPFISKSADGYPKFVPYTPPIGIPGDARDRRTFHYFRSRTNNAMFRHFESSCFEADFWDGLVLQISHSHPTVRHAILALGALYEEYDITRSSRGNTPIDGKELHSAFAIKQYNKAVQLLSVDLAADDPSFDSILASCMIFICLEFLRNNPHTALSHLSAGMRIINEISATAADVSRPNNTKSLSKRRNQQIDKSLSFLFGRLHSQAAFHGCPNSDFTPVAAVCLPPAVPTHFTSIIQARVNLEDMFSSLFEILRQVRISEKAPISLADVEELGVCHPVWGPLFQNYLDLFERWYAALNDLVSRMTLEAKLEKGQELAIKLMKLHHRVVIIAFRTLQLGEIGFDAYIPSFREMLADATLIIDAMDPECSELPTLSVDIGVIAPLFYVLWKCRDNTIRYPALELLRRAPVREGIWRRESAIQFVEWKIAREELEAVKMGWQPGELLPEGARIFWEQLREVEGDDGTPVTIVTFRRKIGDSLQAFEEVANVGIEMGDVA